MLQFKTTEELSEEMMLSIQKKIPQITNFKTGGVMRLFIEVTASFLNKIYQQIFDLLPQLFTHSATGSWIDQYAEELGLTRHPATKTIGKLTLYRKDVSNNITIPKDKIFATVMNSNGQVFRFKSISESVIEKNQTEIDIDIIAEESGTNYNVFENTITEIVTVIPGIDSINNKPAWIISFGTDKESDDSLKSRCLSMWKSINGANKDAYESWVRSVAGIDQVKILPQFRGLGTIDILILGEKNELPSKQIVDEVLNVVNTKKPIGTDLIVKSPTEVRINLSIDISHQKNIVISKQQILDKIYSFFSTMTIGQNFEESALNAKIFEVTGISSVYISSSLEQNSKNLLKLTDSQQILPFQIAKLGIVDVLIHEEI